MSFYDTRITAAQKAVRTRQIRAKKLAAKRSAAARKAWRTRRAVYGF